MKSIVVSMTKGGVGKTTIAVSLAGELARAGKRVLLVDMDTQASTTLYFGLDPAPHSKRVLVDGVALDSSVVQVRPNLWVLPGDDTTEEASSFLTSIVNQQAQAGDVTIFSIWADILAMYDDAYDYVITDTPPAGALQNVCLLAADLVVAPTPTRRADVNGLVKFVGTLYSLYEQAGVNHPPVLVVPNMYRLRTIGSQRQLGSLLEGIDSDDPAFEAWTVLPFTIKQLVDFEYGPELHKLASEINESGRAAEQMRALTRHVLKILAEPNGNQAQSRPEGVKTYG